MNIEGGETTQASYWRGLIGPGFLSERPNVIEWIKRPNRESQATPECKLMEFQLANPQADEINQVFTKLGIDVPVSNGKSSIGITIDTPKGRWEIENEGVRWTMPGMLLEVAALWWRTRN